MMFCEMGQRKCYSDLDKAVRVGDHTKALLRCLWCGTYSGQFSFVPTTGIREQVSHRVLEKESPPQLVSSNFSVGMTGEITEIRERRGSIHPIQSVFPLGQCRFPELIFFSLSFIQSVISLVAGLNLTSIFTAMLWCSVLSYSAGASIPFLCVQWLWREITCPSRGLGEGKWTWIESFPSVPLASRTFSHWEPEGT